MGTSKFFTHSRHILAFCFCKKTKVYESVLYAYPSIPEVFLTAHESSKNPRNPMKLPIAMNFLPPTVFSYIPMLLDKLKELSEDVLCYR